MTDKLKAIGVSLKWEHYRDSVRKLFITSSENDGQKEYEERMSKLQTVIKGVAKKHEVSTIKAVTAIADGEEGMMALQFLAAGYELVSGNDFTAENDSGDKG